MLKIELKEQKIEAQVGDFIVLKYGEVKRICKFKKQYFACDKKGQCDFLTFESIEKLIKFYADVNNPVRRVIKSGNMKLSEL